MPNADAPFLEDRDLTATKGEQAWLPYLPIGYGPAWRYDKARLCCDEPTARYRGPDAKRVAWLADALRREDQGRPLAADAHPDWDRFCRARELGHCPDTRLEVEARILARQPFGKTARAVGLEIIVVTTYFHYFFDVCRYLDASSRLLSLVVDNEEKREEHLRAEVLRTAYFGGSVVVDELFRNGVPRPDSHDLKTPLGRMWEQLEIQALLRAWQRGGSPMKNGMIPRELMAFAAPRQKTISELLEAQLVRNGRHPAPDAQDRQSLGRQTA